MENQDNRRKRTTGDALRDLFSTRIILKRQKNNTVKSVNFDDLLKYGEKSAKRITHKGAYSTFRGGGGSGYHPYGSTNTRQIEHYRHTLYGEYDAMDQDSIISSALDIYAEEATSEDLNGDILSISTQDPMKKKLLYNLLYEILDVEDNLWFWVREACKYGDFMLYMKINHKLGVTDIIPINPANMSRTEENGEISFTYEGDDSEIISRLNGKKKFGYHEIVHIRLGKDSNYLPYGKSILAGGRNTFKKMMMLEDAMLIHRIMRAPDRRMVIVDVGAIHPDDVDAYMEDIVNEAKRVPYKDDDGNYNLRFNLMNSIEDIYIPSRGGAQGTKIENLPGLENAGQIDDIEYEKSKLLAFLKIPKPYLNYDESTDGKAMLANEDMRFAKTIQRIQRSVVTQIHKIAFVHLFMNGYRDEELLDFEIKMPMGSIIARRQKMDLFMEQVKAAADAKDLEMFSDKYIYENLFEMTKEEWEAERDQIPEDLKFMFRLAQIKEEGNDPSVTGEVYGTPHALMMLQKASDALGLERDGESVKDMFSDDGRANNEGQPEKNSKWETDRDGDFGRDPTGRKVGTSIPKKISDSFRGNKTVLYETDATDTDRILEKYSKLIEKIEEQNENMVEIDNPK